MANPSLNDATPYSAITAVLVGSMRREKGLKSHFLLLLLVVPTDMPLLKINQACKHSMVVKPKGLKSNHSSVREVMGG